MNKRSRDDIIFDTILEQAFNDAAEARFSEIEKECPKNTQLSEKHKKIERKAYQKYTQRNRSVSLSSRLKPFHKVAACFVAVLLAGAIMVFAVPTARADFCNLVITFFEKCFSLNAATASSPFKDKVEDYNFEYIPDNYAQTAFNDIGGIEYTFESILDDTYFIIGYYPSNDTSIFYDNEHTIVTQCTVNNNVAYLIYFEKSDDYALTWNDGDNLFNITGTIHSDEILKIADNISKNFP